MLLFTMSVQMVSGQDLTAYTSVRGHFFAFFKGQAIQLSHLPPTSFTLAKNYLVFTDNAGNFLYFNPDTSIQEPQNLALSVERVNTSEAYLSYEAYGHLKVFTGANQQTLSAHVQHWESADSMVCWFDNVEKQLLVFQDDEIIELEDALVNDPILNFKVADNLVGYVDNHQQLMVFYQQQKHYLCQASPPAHFKVAKNIVAYIDKSAGTFNLFYKGHTTQLAPFRPISYKVADNRLAYVDNGGRFFLFDDEELLELSSFAPEEFWLRDSILVYFENRELIAYWQGKTFLLEEYLPREIQVQLGSLCYINEMDQLVLFQDGKKKIVSYDRPSRFYLHYNTLVYYLGNGQPNVYYKEHTYK